ncbi:MAG TPA: FISUMP domain-containing protein [Bacteroidales bacterium]|nr:FISUMP domain-containing protein [Bacteroidales bacterium]
MRGFFTLFSIILWIQASYSQQGPYARVMINLQPSAHVMLAAAGIALEDCSVQEDGRILADLNEIETAALRKMGIPFTVMVSDVGSMLAERYQQELSAADVMAGLLSQKVQYQVPSHFYLGSMGGFYTWENILNQLDSMALLFPELISSKQAISQTLSHDGNPVYWLRISDNPLLDEDEPEILYTALHHAREPLGMQQLLYFMWYLLENYENDSMVRQLVDHTELYFIPVVNPDGYLYNQQTNPSGGGMWRKNRSDNGDGSFGVDINRNYGFFWGFDDIGSSPVPSHATFRGTAAFSEPETQNVRDLCLNHGFRLGLNYHTGTCAFLFPWGYTADSATVDDSLYRFFSARMTAESGLESGTISELLYTGNGSSEDWMYGEQAMKPKILSFCPEVSEFWPSLTAIVPYCHRYLHQNITAARLAGHTAGLKVFPPEYLSSFQAYLHYEIQREGLAQPASFTVSLLPLDPVFDSVGGDRQYNDLAIMEKRCDSLFFRLSNTVSDGDVVRMLLRLDNGYFSEYDTVEILLYSEIRGTVTYKNPGNLRLGNTKVLLTAQDGSVLDSVPTDRNGKFCFRNLENGNYTIRAEPSAPFGGVNSIDALQILNHFIQLISLSGINFTAGDVNLSGNLNSIDALLVQRRFVELISAFPLPDWVSENHSISVDSLSGQNVNIRVLCAGDVNGSFIPLPCHPPLSQPQAGTDTLDVEGTSLVLAASDLQWGETGTWKIVTGFDGSFSDIHYPAAAFQGVPGEFYRLRWISSNACGTDSSEVVVSFADNSIQPCPDLQYITYQGKRYHTVQIGDQCWMRENLDAGLMIAGSQEQSDNGVTEKYCYDDDPLNCERFGALYQWDELMQYQQNPGRGLCPDGWRVATDNDWCTMLTFLDPLVVCDWGLSGTDAGGKIKLSGNNYWKEPNAAATNISGFSAKGSGFRETVGSFRNLKKNCQYWTSTMQYTTHGIFWLITWDQPAIHRFNAWQEEGYSARCIRNDCAPISAAYAGEDQVITDATCTVLEANVPAAEETASWTILSGQGGWLEDPSNPASVFCGVDGDAYLLVWTIDNICGESASDTVLLSFGGNPWQPCNGILTVDYDNKTYHTVEIGNQCWLAENMDIGVMIAGAQEQTDNTVIEKYCYDDEPLNCEIYGGLYQWREMMQYQSAAGVQGICPDGWHVASDSDWCELAAWLDQDVSCDWGLSGTVAGGSLKESGFDHWAPPNEGATNSSGFTCLPSGNRNLAGEFSGLTLAAPIWTSTIEYTTHGIFWLMMFGGGAIERYNFWQEDGYAVRCMKNQ